MADSAFAVKIDGKPHTVDRFTLGDWRLLKTEFGLNSSDILTTLPPNEKGESVQTLNVDDPNVLIGLLVVALHHKRPLAPIAALVAEVEALGVDGFEFVNDEPEESESDAAPLAEGDDAVTERPAKSGKSGKRQKQPGTPH